MYGFNHNRYVFFRALALYGIYAAASEGISKHGSAIFQRKDTATAIGNYSVSKLFHHAGQFLGLIWYQFGADVTL
jgi:hypothetical protein